MKRLAKKKQKCRKRMGYYISVNLENEKIEITPEWAYAHT